MKLIVLLGLLIANSAAVANTDSLAWIKKEFPLYSLFYTAADASVISIIEKDLYSGTKHVVAFFKRIFAERFNVYIFPNRKMLDETWRKDWNMQDFNSECWMVASGVAKRLDVLSPKRWSKEACEHKESDSIELQQIITHELTHVYHAQSCTNHTFDDMDGLSWFVEGLATYASGQLTDSKIKTVKEIIATGKIPEKLADFWKGRARYQQAGSLVKFIDTKYGRDKLIALLKHATLDEMLETLQTTEEELISGWKDFYK